MKYMLRNFYVDYKLVGVSHLGQIGIAMASSKYSRIQTWDMAGYLSIL